MAKKQDDITWGKKMIKVSINFWTNDLPKGTDMKTAWGHGAIHMIANKQRGLKHDNVFFKNMDEFMKKLGELLKRNGVTLITQSAKYEVVDLSKLGG